MLILRLGYAYCVFFIYSYFLLCDFGKTRTTFFENTYDFSHKHVRLPVKHNRVFKLLMFSDLCFVSFTHLLYGKLSHRHSINHNIPPCRSAACYVSITGCLQ